MAITDSSAPAHPDTRELRALELYRRHGAEIEEIAPDIYMVPSQDGERAYRVDYASETCSCPDAEFHPELNCKHVLCVGIYCAKHRVRPELVAGDPFAYAGRQCFTCYDGYVFVGRLVVDPETGEEVEVLDAVPCRRCNAR